MPVLETNDRSEQLIFEACSRRAHDLICVALTGITVEVQKYLPIFTSICYLTIDLSTLFPNLITFCWYKIHFIRIFYVDT